MLMTEERAERLAARVRGPFPNSHLFVKAVCGELCVCTQCACARPHPATEKMIEQRGYSMRVVLLRPSLITAAAKHPVPGWIDSTNGMGAFVSDDDVHVCAR
jgi:hypothetical protein